MAMPLKVDILFDQTSAANSVLSTGTIDTSQYTSILLCVLFSAAASGAPSVSLRDAGTTALLNLRTVNVASLSAMLSYGLGGGGAGDNAVGYVTGPSGALPPTVTASVTAAGVGVTSRLVVYGRRNHRGPDVSSTPD